MDRSGLEPERVLVERVLAGDEAAFATLVDRFCTPMSRLAHAILGDSTHVQDALQETWIAVLGSLPSFEWRASFKTWVLRILSNRARTLAARLGRDACAQLGGGVDDEQEVDPSRFSRFGWWRDPPVAVAAAARRSRGGAGSQAVARARDERARSLAAQAARGGHASRCRGAERGGDLRDPRAERGEPARTLASWSFALARGRRAKDRRAMILTCKQLVKRVTDAREGRLSAIDRAGYRIHLMRCRHCRTYVAQMDAVIDAMSGAPPGHDGSARLQAALASLMRARKE